MFPYYFRQISSSSEKISLLVRNRTFPLPSNVFAAFQNLTLELENAISVNFEPGITLAVKTNAPDIATTVSLNQNG